MENNNERRNDIFSKVVKAGKRTYFFDVKETKRGDYYLTLTESKRRFTDEGERHFEKHKVFLYREDFQKFESALTESLEFIRAERPEMEEYSDDNEFSTEEF
jgi:hypothetical protein